MGRTLKEKLATLPKERQKRIEEHAAILAQEYACLKALRQALGQTQIGLAEAMGIKQASISKLEAQDDMHLSTLAAYVKGLGGSLNISVSFPGHDPVVVNGLGDIEPS